MATKQWWLWEEKKQNCSGEKYKQSTHFGQRGSQVGTHLHNRWTMYVDSKKSTRECVFEHV